MPIMYILRQWITFTSPNWPEKTPPLTLAELEGSINDGVHLAAMVPVLGQAAVNTYPAINADRK